MSAGGRIGGSPPYRRHGIETRNFVRTPTFTENAENVHIATIPSHGLVEATVETLSDVPNLHIEEGGGDD